MGIQDQQRAMAKFHKSNDTLRGDFPVVSQTFDALLEVFAAWQPIPSARERNRIIKVGMTAGVVALAFPPFYLQGATGARLGLGHSFILTPPKATTVGDYSGSIDAFGLFAILIGIALITWAATLVRWSGDQ